MQERSVQQWVDYIQTLHHREIELSLDRVRQVYQRLYPLGMSCKVITVAGTNGKGSTAEIIASIYAQSGCRVGKFSSPHLVDFAERYSINGSNVSNQALLDAFVKIEQARAEIPITFFEFGALLAIELFSAAEVDIAVMEVGLGGRLDAINIIDADVAIITSISIDHTAWLGNTVEEIGREKAGIARANRPCIVGIKQPPQSIIEYCAEIGANMQLLGRDFDYQESTEVTDSWFWSSAVLDKELGNLPLPFSQAGVQLSNASLAIHAVSLLNDELAVTDEQFAKGIEAASILARCQVVSESPLLILDVAHNESSMTRLRTFVDQKIASKGGRTDTTVYAVCGMLQDKEISKSLSCFLGLVDHWSFVTIDNERGASAEYLSSVFNEVSANEPSSVSVNTYDKIAEAYYQVSKELTSNDILVVFGSFFVAGDILKLINK